MGETETEGEVGDLEIGPSSLQQEWVDPWADMMVELIWLMRCREEGECDSLLRLTLFYALTGLISDRF